jgi:hypothetical protein
MRVGKARSDGAPGGRDGTLEGKSRRGSDGAGEWIPTDGCEKAARMESPGQVLRLHRRNGESKRSGPSVMKPAGGDKTVN